MKYSLFGGAGAVAIMSMTLFSSVTAKEEAIDEMLSQDTVVCIKNEVEDKEAVAVVGEYFYNSRPNARPVSIKSDKTICMRYRRAKEIKPVIVAADDLKDGKLKEGAERVECKRTKGGFAKFYILRVGETGRKQCVADPERAGDSTRALVKGRKAINSK